MPDDHTENTPPAPSQAERIKPYRWKPGQSGNPGGRPRNESITAKLRRVLASEHNGREIADLIAERIVKEALSGKFPFAKELLDRIDGLPGKEPKGDVRIVIADYRTQAERPGTAEDIRRIALGDAYEREATPADIRALMAPRGSEREGTFADIEAVMLGKPVEREGTFADIEALAMGRPPAPKEGTG